MDLEKLEQFVYQLWRTNSAIIVLAERLDESGDDIDAAQCAFMLADHVQSIGTSLYNMVTEAKQG